MPNFFPILIRTTNGVPILRTKTWKKSPENINYNHEIWDFFHLRDSSPMLFAMIRLMVEGRLGLGLRIKINLTNFIII